VVRAVSLRPQMVLEADDIWWIHPSPWGVRWRFAPQISRVQGHLDSLDDHGQRGVPRDHPPGRHRAWDFTAGGL